MPSPSFSVTLGMGLSVLSLVACQTQPGTTATGAAHTADATDESRIERCEEPVGLASLSEPDAETRARLESLELGSALPSLRMAMVRSNCFQVVDLDAVAGPERADERHFAVRPQVTLSNPDAGGVEGVGDLAEMFGLSGDGEAGGNVTAREAKAILFLSDARTGLLELAAEGSATAHDLSGLALGGFGEFSADRKAAEAELFATAFLDALNNLVVQIRNEPAAMVTASGSAS